MNKKEKKRLWKRIMVCLLALIITICGGCNSKEEKEPDFLHFGDTDGVIGTAERIRGEVTLMAKIDAPKITVPHTDPDENGDFYKPSQTGTQGAYFDGRYLYQTFIKYCYNYDLKYQQMHQMNDLNNLVVIVKYDVIKQKVVKTSEPLKLQHAGDFAYNSKLGYLVVAHGSPGMLRVSYVDPETLEIVESFDTQQRIYGIEYNEKTDKYAIGNALSWGYMVTDTDFNRISPSYSGLEESKAYTCQCISADENYIYWMFYGTGTNKLTGDTLETDAIIVYDWEGQFVSFIEFDLGFMEPESINVVNGDIYIGTSMSQKAYFYRISSLKPMEYLKMGKL